MAKQVYHGNFSDPNSNVTPDDPQLAAIYYQDGLNALLANIWAWSVGDQDWVQQALPVKVYRALLTQSGTDAPVATVLENSLGGVPVWSYESGGSYRLTLALAFPTDKTSILMNTFSNASGTNSVNYYLGTGSYVEISSGDDDALVNNAIEILVYP